MSERTPYERLDRFYPLLVLARQPGMAMDQSKLFHALSDEWECDPRSTERVVSQLRRGGYLLSTPDPDDRRRKKLCLTESGVDALRLAGPTGGATGRNTLFIPDAQGQKRVLANMHQDFVARYGAELRALFPDDRH